jgi:hypothetical protein
MAVQISDIKINAGRHTAGVTGSVEQKDVGVRITSSSVVIFDPETDDQWLVMSRKDFATISELLQVTGLGHVSG